MKSNESILIENQESATVQSAKQNVQDEPTADSGFAKPAEAAFEPQAGGGSAPSPCSGVGASGEGLKYPNLKALRDVDPDDKIKYFNGPASLSDILKDNPYSRPCKP